MAGMQWLALAWVKVEAQLHASRKAASWAEVLRIRMSWLQMAGVLSIVSRESKSPRHESCVVARGQEDSR